MAKYERQQRRQRRRTAGGARSAEGRAAGGQVHVAGVLQMAERHAQQEQRRRAFTASARNRSTRPSFQLRRRPPGDLRVRGPGRDAGRVRARRPGQLPDRRRRRGRAEPRHPAAIGRSQARRLDGHPGHPRHRQRRPQRLRRHQGDVQHRRRRVEEGHRGARRAVAEALGGVRHRHQSDERDGRSGRSAASAIIERVTTVVIGAGHAGLAASRCLSERSIDHVVLERGEVANSWRHERWDSLRLLTPNWQSRLPGYRYDGADPDGFMTMAEVVAFVARLRDGRAAPVRTHTTVTAVRASDDGYHVVTTRGDIALPHRRHRERRLQSRRTSRLSVQAVPSSIAAFTAPRLPQSQQSAGRRRAGRRRVGHRRAARRRNPALRPPRHAVGRRTRAAAANVSRPRRAVVDGRLRRLESALRRDRRSDARAPAAVAAARRHARAHDARPQRARARPASRSSGVSPPSATAARSSPAASAISSRWPTSRWIACWTPSTSGRGRTGATPTSPRPSASSRRAPRRHRDSRSTSAAARSGRSSGRPVFVPTTAGSTCPSSMPRDTCSTTAGSSTRRDSTPSACPSCAAASRRSSTAPRTTPATSSSILRGILDRGTFYLLVASGFSRKISRLKAKP